MLHNCGLNDCLHQLLHIHTADVYSELLLPVRGWFRDNALFATSAAEWATLVLLVFEQLLRKGILQLLS
jgi:hypothetical protein